MYILYTGELFIGDFKTIKDIFNFLIECIEEDRVNGVEPDYTISFPDGKNYKFSKEEDRFES